MNVAIVKYNAGNIYSVANALRRLGIEASLTDSPEELTKADKVIFPGQGEASTAMEYLRTHRLDSVIKGLRQPVLGIRPARQDDKVPAMGWNSIHRLGTKLFDGVADNDFVYFVHSYYVPLCPDTIATTDHILTYSAALHKDNFYSTQFHPEKSGSVGERILKNFLYL